MIFALILTILTVKDCSSSTINDLFYYGTKQFKTITIPEQTETCPEHVYVVFDSKINSNASNPGSGFLTFQDEKNIIVDQSTVLDCKTIKSTLLRKGFLINRFNNFVSSIDYDDITNLKNNTNECKKTVCNKCTNNQTTETKTKLDEEIYEPFSFKEILVEFLQGFFNDVNDYIYILIFIIIFIIWLVRIRKSIINYFKKLIDNRNLKKNQKRENEIKFIIENLKSDRVEVINEGKIESLVINVGQDDMIGNKVSVPAPVSNQLPAAAIPPPVTNQLSAAAIPPPVSNQLPAAAIPPPVSNQLPAAAIPPPVSNQLPAAAIPPLESNQVPAAAIPPLESNQVPAAAIPPPESNQVPAIFPTPFPTPVSNQVPTPLLQPVSKQLSQYEQALLPTPANEQIPKFLPPPASEQIISESYSSKSNDSLLAPASQVCYLPQTSDQVLPQSTTFPSMPPPASAPPPPPSFVPPPPPTQSYYSTTFPSMPPPAPPPPTQSYYSTTFPSMPPPAPPPPTQSYYSTTFPNMPPPAPPPVPAPSSQSFFYTPKTNDSELHYYQPLSTYAHLYPNVPKVGTNDYEQTKDKQEKPVKKNTRSIFCKCSSMCKTSNCACKANDRKCGIKCHKDVKSVMCTNI